MSALQPKTFFVKLKETCKKIDDDIGEVKKKFYELPGNENLASMKIREIQDKIKIVKTEANELRSVFNPKLEHNENFIQHFKELTAETEVLISRQEHHLQQYGYKPLELVTESADPVPTEDNVISVKSNRSQEKEKRPITPNFLDCGIVSGNCFGPTSETDRKSSFDDYVIPKVIELKDSIKAQVKNSDSTPTLDVNLAAEDDIPPGTEHFSMYTPVSPSTPTLEL